MTTEDQKKVGFRVELDEDLRAKFKAACAIKKVSMTDVLVEYIKDWTEANYPKN
jgi:thiamine pyrophosphate-dependent acetolactate synthase large subunit-like protein